MIWYYSNFKESDKTVKPIGSHDLYDQLCPTQLPVITVNPLYLWSINQTYRRWSDVIDQLIPPPLPVAFGIFYSTVIFIYRVLFNLLLTLTGGKLTLLLANFHRHMSHWVDVYGSSLTRDQSWLSGQFCTFFYLWICKP